MPSMRRDKRKKPSPEPEDDLPQTEEEWDLLAEGVALLGKRWAELREYCQRHNLPLDLKDPVVSALFTYGPPKEENGGF